MSKIKKNIFKFQIVFFNILLRCFFINLNQIPYDDMSHINLNSK
jgi:hypothetical protein